MTSVLATQYGSAVEGIGLLRAALPCTATASPLVREDVCVELDLDHASLQQEVMFSSKRPTARSSTWSCGELPHEEKARQIVASLPGWETRIRYRVHASHRRIS